MNTLAPIRSPHGATQARILVVDDHGPSRTGLGELLADEGYDVDLAASVDDAIAQVSAHRPDLVISDVRMAHTDGFALASALHAHTQTIDVPVILVSAIDDDAWLKRAASVGVRDYLTKPVDPDALLQLVRSKILATARTSR